MYEQSPESSHNTPNEQPLVEGSPEHLNLIEVFSEIKATLLACLTSALQGRCDSKIRTIEEMQTLIIDASDQFARLTHAVPTDKRCHYAAGLLLSSLNEVQQAVELCGYTYEVDETITVDIIASMFVNEYTPDDPEQEYILFRDSFEGAYERTAGLLLAEAPSGENDPYYQLIEDLHGHDRGASVNYN